MTRGVQVEIITPTQLRAVVPVDTASQAISLGSRSPAEYAAVFFRGLADSFTQFEILQLAEARGLRVINSIQSYLSSKSKLLTTALLGDAGLPVVPSLVTHDIESAIEFTAQHRETVVKPVYGMEGIDVERVTHRRAGEVLPPLLRRYRAVCLQAFLQHGGEDVRCFVIGRRVVASMRRLAPPGGWKTNFSTGGSVQGLEAPARIAALAIEATDCLGLQYAGVDIVQDGDRLLVLEVNGDPSWQGLLQATGRNMAGPLIDYVITLAKGDAT